MALIAMVLILFVAAAHSAAVPDEKGCPDNPPKETCSARQDVVLVVDNSYSVAGRHNDISEWMRQFVGLYDLTKDDPRSPQIGVVTFNGCVGCSSSQSVEVIYPVSNDEAALLDAINTRKDPDPEMPMTCISCAISVAVQMLSAFGQAENMPLIMLLTDGEQTVLGGDEAAVYAAEQAKAQGVNVVSLSLGRADQDTMDRIASLPTETYSRNADTVEQLLDEAPLPLSPSATSATANARFPAPPLAGDRSRQYLLHPSRARMPPPERLPGAGARAPCPRPRPRPPTPRAHLSNLATLPCQHLLLLHRTGSYNHTHMHRHMRSHIFACTSYAHTGAAVDPRLGLPLA